MTQRQEWGACWLGDGRTNFRVWAPQARDLMLEIEGRAPAPMRPAAEGWFERNEDVGPGGRYRYSLSTGQVMPDPAARALSGGVHGWSVVVDPASYHWQVNDWPGRPWREAVFLELHCGLLGGFQAVAQRLPDLARLGVTAVQLMPVAAFGGARNWGYDGVAPYAPADAYGAPDDLKALVDKAHSLGLMIFLDVVYNHFGPEGNYLPTLAPEFFDEGSSTPWGAAIAFQREPVARFFIDNAIYWLGEFRFDGLRFDAVHAITDKGFLKRMATEIEGALTDRSFHLVLENEANDPEPLKAGYRAQWNDDFHNVMHVLLTGETDSYYSDFAERPAHKLARCLAEGFVYQGEPSPSHEGRARGAPSADLPPTAFVGFLQNHDQIGNRAMGERLISMCSPGALRAAMGLLLLTPHIPMLFMGEEAGAQTPFLFFTDFHDELAEAVREGRRREFSKSRGFDTPEARALIPDPNAPETFERSVPVAGPDAPAWRGLITGLLARRRALLNPKLDDCECLGAHVIGDKAVTAAWRLGSSRLTVAVNLGDSLSDAVSAPPTEPVVAIGAGLAQSKLTGESFLAWWEPFDG